MTITEFLKQYNINWLKTKKKLLGIYNKKGYNEHVINFKNYIFAL